MTNNPQPEKKPESIRPSRRELGASLLLPIIITLVIWVAGVAVYALAPGEFDTVISLAISAGLLLFLVFWTRRESTRTRLIAILLAVPALIGISLGLVNGRADYTIIGVGVTFLLLLLQRVLSVPASYRAAYRQFRAGRDEEALRLINKSIAARPDYAESYALRALIHLSRGAFAAAAQDAEEAIRRNPQAHPTYHTLGQVYLMQGQHENAAAAYEQAVALAPNNPLYRYHLGLSLFRQGAYNDAAQALAAATQGTLPTIEYDLLAYYYLGRSLAASGDEVRAQRAFAAMTDFADGLSALDKRLSNQPDYPHLRQMKADLEDLRRKM